MRDIIYINSAGFADTNLNVYDGRHGKWQINIGATGVTQGMVDWQFTGVMFCHNTESDDHRTIGLIWDQTRIVTDYEGVTFLSREEKDALRAAGFDTYNFAFPGGTTQTESIVDALEEADEAGDWNATDFIIAYENGELDEENTIDGFQALLDSGLVWQLQGSYQRMATALLETGLIRRKDRWADGN